MTTSGTSTSEQAIWKNTDLISWMHRIHESSDKLTLGSARQGETKWIDLAPVKGRLLMLVYVMRGDVVRCISMSVANRKESRWYDEFKIDDTLH